MYHCVRRQKREVFDDYYNFVSNVSRHHLRSVNDDKLYLPLFKKKSGQNSIKYKEIEMWNSLPKNVKILNFGNLKEKLYVK